MLEVLIPKLMPKSWVPWVEEDLKVNDFDFFSAFVSGCHILSQSSESLPVCFFSYSFTTAQPPPDESAVLIKLFLFFIFVMIPLVTLRLIPVHLRYCR